MASTEAEARTGAESAPLSLALVDLGLSADGVAFAQALRRATGAAVPLMIFAGSVKSAADIPALTNLGVRYINEHSGTPQILPAIAPHLFPDSFNRRTSARVALGVPVSFRFGKSLAVAVTLDIGTGGIGIRTMEPIAKDSTVDVRFRLPGIATELQATGRVAWSDRRVGMGVEFVDISATDSSAIESFVEGQLK
jgi:uncharacterized protein (TIGR02266 family)